jgi:hypothetical protein
MVTRRTRSIVQIAKIALAACLGTAIVFAQSTAPDTFLHWMDQVAQQQLTRRETTVAGIRTTADADRRREQVRARLLQLIGGLPGYHGPLNARVTGASRLRRYPASSLRAFFTSTVFI